MTRYYIVKFSKKGSSKAVAMTYDKDEAIVICEHPKTSTPKWFYGWTATEPRGANPNTLPRVADLLHDLNK